MAFSSLLQNSEGKSFKKPKFIVRGPSVRFEGLIQYSLNLYLYEIYVIYIILIHVHSCSQKLQLNTVHTVNIHDANVTTSRFWVSDLLL